MGGFLSWRVGNFLPVMLGLWPVIALSGTLAGEAAKGSLDLLAATPQSRRTIALEKLAGHVTAVAFAMLILAVAIWAVGAGVRVAAGRRDPVRGRGRPGRALRAMMLFVGGVSFATAPFVGRTRAMAFGLIVLFASYLIYSYATPVAGHRRAQAAVVLHLDGRSPPDGRRHGLGIRRRCWPSSTSCCSRSASIAFARRDLGGVANVGWLRLPSLPAGIAGPFSRQLADRAGVAIAWGLGIGLYGILIVASADAFSDMIGNLPQIAALINSIYPGLDLTQPSAVLQLTFFSFGSFIFGLAGAGFLAGWAGDEGRRRLEVVLSTPRSRASWTVRSGLGVLAASGVVDAHRGRVHRGRGRRPGWRRGAAGGGHRRPRPGGGRVHRDRARGRWARAGVAGGGVTAVLVIATMLLDTLGAALKLPEWVLDLSLYQHLGQPMAGSFDPVGIAVAAIMVVGGVAVCAFGLTRRDIGR